MNPLLVVALAVLVSLSACAPMDAPAWCGEYCRATAAQAVRCVPGTDRRATEASCSRQLGCLTVTSVRSLPLLEQCLDALPDVCGTPDECRLQFR